LASAFASGGAFPKIGSLIKPTTDKNVDGHKIISTVRDLQQKAVGIVNKQKSLGKRVAAATSPTSYPCSDGGSMSFDTASNPAIYSFTACKQGSEYMDGTMTMPQGVYGATSSTTGGSLSVNLTTISYANGGYTTKEKESVMKMTMAFSSFDNSAGTASYSINGTSSSVDYIAKTSEKQAFSNFSISMSDNTSATTYGSVNMTMDGSVTMDSYKDTTFTTVFESSGMTFQKLILVETSSANSTSQTIDGTYAIQTIPACMDGTFVISTQKALTTINGSGVTTGQMTVNGVVMVFNADGTVTATINGVPQAIPSYTNVCSLSF
jgi:hypothetical protein